MHMKVWKTFIFAYFTKPIKHLTFINVIKADILLPDYLMV